MAKSMWTMPFGKHEGEDIEDIPTSYLRWLLDQEWFPEKYPRGYEYADAELNYREQFGE
jgi:hypothetical protein